MRTGAPLALALVGMLAAGWATRLNLHAAQAAERSTHPTLEPRPIVPIEAVSLPAFSIGPTDDAVTRQMDLFTQIPHRARVDVLRYTVQSGDSVFAIAEKFGLKPETILWGNLEVLEDDPHLLRQGQELNVLPVDGTYYQWQSGDDLEAVAASYGIPAQAILDWPGNGLDPFDPDIQPGAWLVVPGGSRPFRQWLVPTIARGRAGVGTAYGSGGCSGDYSGGAVGGGGFIWPSANHYVSGNDYWSGHLAIDIAAGLGTRVWAADGGVVVFAGWSNGGYGKVVMVDHGNGWQTLYAHLNDLTVTCGQSVSQGQTIGFAGSTGNSTGPHLHFETRFEAGFVNPWLVLP